ncbi:MAG TPA: hypothetical protein VHR66_18130 [Gemmataceae bacterium]|jgi:hypothetical protein|nr:hypothetical protein [Gemmataceae bacterium]
MSSRREFLADVGRGMLVASVGPAVALDLGLTRAIAKDAPDTLNFGKLEPLAAFLQDTPTDKLMGELVKKLKDGLDLKTLVAAGALSNAREFGGQHYEGYHTFMALAPAFEMSKELPESSRALPVLKVLFRNSTHIQAKGGRKNEALHPIEAAPLPADAIPGEAIRDATRKNDRAGAEAMFATVAKGMPSEAFDTLQYCVHDEVNVHRVVLAWRAWTMLDYTGPEQAHTLLRQSVLFACREKGRDRGIHTVLPKLLDQYKLVGKKMGTRQADDAWIEKMAKVIYGDGSEKAADAVAAALAEGFSAESIAQANSLASNMLVLRDPGRRQADGFKQIGSVHGDSPGVHASDAANAWRHIAAVSNQRNAVASLIVGAFHTGGQSGGQLKDPYPLAEHLEKVTTSDPAELLKATETAVKAQDQALACALVHKYGKGGHNAKPVFDLLLKYAVSEDGALHAEKFYRTVSEEFAATRPAFRWRQLEALARVTASEYGKPAPGVEEARRLLG